MPFDFAPDRSRQGLKNYNDGLAAEGAVARFYMNLGYDIVADRWRGKAGEVDLIFRDPGGFVFVEVKKSKTFDAAAASLSRRQLLRIARAAEEFVGASQTPLANIRLDLAMVNGMGEISILENLTLF